MAEHLKMQAQSETGAAAGVAAVLEREPETEATNPPVHHEEVARLAYAYWQARGCPEGSPDEDWLRAEAELQAQARGVAA